MTQVFVAAAQAVPAPHSLFKGVQASPACFATAWHIPVMNPESVPVQAPVRQSSGQLHGPDTAGGWHVPIPDWIGPVASTQVSWPSMPRQPPPVQGPPITSGFGVVSWARQVPVQSEPLVVHSVPGAHSCAAIGRVR